MNPDLVSIVFRLHNPQPASLAADQGRALAAQFLAWVAALDPELSSKLHDESNLPRPYTVSNFFDLPKPNKGLVYLPAGSDIWFRVTCLQPELSVFLVDCLMPSLPKEVTVGDAVFVLDDATWSPEDHPWAGWVNYAGLIENDFLGRAGRKLRFQFASATAFHTRGTHLPYILPELAVPSWLKDWNAFAPVTFPAEIRKAIHRGVAVSYYKMQTLPVRYGKATLVGGIGHCTFNLLSPDPYLRHVANVLASFSFYCGTGVKTALGMGQTRRLGEGAYRRLKASDNTGRRV
jgi:CRISPR-associated endoribonuclease Cas6